MRGNRRLGASLVAGAALVATVAATAAAAPQGQEGQSQAKQQPQQREQLRAASQLKVMSLNAWVGGSWVNDSLRKQVQAVKKFRPDVIGMQETRGHSAKDLARQLGWHSYQSGDDIGVVSRYPVKQTGSTSAGAGVQIQLPGGKRVELWSAHMYYRPYGAYDACYNRLSYAELVQREVQSGRIQETNELVRELAPKVRRANGTPVLLVGDFNSPSHLDWTAQTKKKHCGYGPVAWPVTKLIETTGLKDSFREVHPDPKAVPGDTWSPVYPRHYGSTGPREPQNRTDYITYAGSGLQARNSQAVQIGKPAPVPHHKNNTWPSDHRAVLTSFTVR